MRHGCYSILVGIAILDRSCSCILASCKKHCLLVPAFCTVAVYAQQYAESVQRRASFHLRSPTPHGRSVHFCFFLMLSCVVTRSCTVCVSNQHATMRLLRCISMAYHMTVIIRCISSQYSAVMRCQETPTNQLHPMPAAPTALQVQHQRTITVPLYCCCAV